MQDIYTKVVIAEEDIPVYVVVKRKKAFAGYDSPSTKFKTGRVLRCDFKIRGLQSKYTRNWVSECFSSYSTEERADRIATKWNGEEVFKAVIPQGAQYFPSSCGQHLYSNEIKVQKINRLSIAIDKLFNK